MSSNVTIKCGNTEAIICPKGAEIISFKGSDGRERIWQADPDVWGRHAPVLFPVCCAVKNKSVIIDGVSYPMVKHGFVRDWEFEVAGQSASTVNLVMRPDMAAKRMLPFDYELHVRFEVYEDGFNCEFEVVNKSEKVMPFCIGGHPGFVCPMEEGAAFEDYDVVFPETESGVVSLLNSEGEITGRAPFKELECRDRFSLKHEFFDERDTLIFPELKSRSVKLINRNTGKGINFDFAKMPVLAIWTKPKANACYVCLEPWQGLPAGVDEMGTFDEKPFAVHLESGCSFKTGYSVRIID